MEPTARPFVPSMALLACLLLSGGPALGRETKFAFDGAPEDAFGSAAAIDADTVVVGAWGDDDQGLAAGAAYVFQRDQGGAGAWGQVAKRTAADGAAEDHFGGAVAISGDTVVVGAWGDDDQGSAAGAAYVFHRNQGGPDAWGQVATLTAADGVAQDYFGSAVAISDDTAVVGAWGDDDRGSEAGSAYVFHRNQGGADAWGQVAKLAADDGAAQDRFGWSLGIRGDAALIAAPGDDDNGSESGSAYTFGRNLGGPEAWGQQEKITATDGAAGDSFGQSVAVDDAAFVVGADQDDHAGTNSGAAYVYDAQPTGDSDGDGVVDSLDRCPATAGVAPYGCPTHSADYLLPYWSIGLSELLRGIQFYNVGEYSCGEGTEDGYAPGIGDRTCAPHASDYNPQDWKINLSELLRAIQFYNSGGYNPDPTTEDGFAPGL